MTVSDLQRRRKTSGISGRLLCVRAGIERSRLSDIERGYLEPSADEVSRIEKALAVLVEARAKVAQVAEEVGWRVP